MIGYVPIMVVGALIFYLGISLLEEALYDTWGRMNKLEYSTVRKSCSSFSQSIDRSQGPRHCAYHGHIRLRRRHFRWHSSGLLELRRADLTQIGNSCNLLW